MRSTSIFWDTSVRIAKARRPSAWTSAATRSRFATVRLAMTISAPALANSSTIDRPMPVPPPVTIATFPGRAKLGTLKGIGIIGLRKTTSCTIVLISWFARPRRATPRNHPGRDACYAHHVARVKCAPDVQVKGGLWRRSCPSHREEDMGTGLPDATLFRLHHDAGSLGR